MPEISQSEIRDRLSKLSPTDIEVVTVSFEQRLLPKHFYMFVRTAWPHVYGDKFVDGWHIAALCYHLQALWEGELYVEDGRKADTLVANLPPGCGKSRITSCLFPAWLWTRKPEAGEWFSSFGQKLCDRDSIDTRRLIMSDWFQKRWGHLFQFMEDANTMRSYRNSAGGWRLSASVKSTAGFGEHPHLFVCVPPGELVTTDAGDIPIDKIVDGQMNVKILSHNDETGKLEFQPIINYERNPAKWLVSITLDSGHKFSVTWDHPVFVSGRGYVYANTINVSDMLLIQSGSSITAASQVSSVERKKPYSRYVYNVKVGQNRNYFVNGVLVHNCDDPHDPEQAQSQSAREFVHDYFTNKISTRGIVKGVKKGICAQRLHEDDLSGFVLASGEPVVHLMIPMEYEPDRKCKTRLRYCDIDDPDETRNFRVKMEWEDPRTVPGELMWPAGMDDEKVGKLKARLRRSHLIAGQLQQRPTSPDGDYFERTWWSNIIEKPGVYHRGIRAWDKASATGTRADYTAGALLAAADDFHIDILDVKRGKWPRKDRDRIILRTAHMDSQLFQDYIVVLEQEGGGGGKDAAEISAEQLRKEGFRVRIERPVVAKEVRWDPLADGFASGRLRFIAGKWNADCHEELLAAPNGRHDDQIDALANAFKYLVRGMARGKIARNMLGLDPDDLPELAKEAPEGKIPCDGCLTLGCEKCTFTGYVNKANADVQRIFDEACFTIDVDELGVRW